MNKIKSFTTRLYGIFLVVFAIGAISFGLSLVKSRSFADEPKLKKAESSSFTNPFKDEFKIVNKVPSFQVIDNEIVGNQVNFLLKNTYKKSISSLYVTVGNEKDNSGYYVELAYSDFKTEISPQDTYTLQLSFEDKLYTDGLTLEAVLFTDDTADGESNFIQEMKDQRRGEKTQLTRGLYLLKSTQFSQANYLSELANIKEKVSSSPVKAKDNAESEAFNSGMSFGRDRLIRYIDEIINKNNPPSFVNIQENISKLQSKLEKIIPKL